MSDLLPMGGSALDIDSTGICKLEEYCMRCLDTARKLRALSQGRPPCILNDQHIGLILPQTLYMRVHPDVQLPTDFNGKE
eukprot:IDg13476t1